MAGRLYGLDALRGVAALAVATFHLAETYHLPAVPIGYSVAVDLFFILSGFVMTRTYEDRLRDGLTTLGFIGLRYRRLFLPLAIGSTIGLAVTAAMLGPSIPMTAAYLLILLFLPAGGPHAFALNVPAWSVFVEIVANALHGAIFARLSNARLLVLTGLCGVLAAGAAEGHMYWGADIVSILWLIPRELTCYLVGIWMFRRYGDAPLGHHPIAAVVALVILLGIALTNAVFEIAALAACPFIVRASLSLPRTQWAAWAGALSYPLYATHFPVILVSFWTGLHPAAGAALVATVAIAVTLAFEIRRRPLAISQELPGQAA
ncbi:Peptidoglycan/LPS O-acetylase OafA/YrhL, contains acyltransferase and SGNH-hydrolase domains [Mesorhizobium sp. NFR06]|nr:Peptidoglycan/LPS O-acetylase OafA/YrhL, contains acyltransferase and SGNH-hydrolase domains [Mesorhizobium sp. NFR06]